MCDTVPGELHVAFPRGDPAGAATIERLRQALAPLAETREAQVDDVRVGVQSLDALLRERGITKPKLATEYHKITVPAAYEDAVLQRTAFVLTQQRMHHDSFPPHWLRMAREGRPLDEFASIVEDVDIADEDPYVLTRNVRTTAAAGGPGGDGARYAMNTEIHRQYLQMVGCAAEPEQDLSGVTIAIVDSGVGNPVRAQLEEGDQLAPEADWVDGDTLANDEHGHGSVMTQIIADGAPGARIVPIRVLDAAARGSEWELISGIESALSASADIINLSLGTGLAGSQVCALCGRRSTAVRARVLQHALEFGMDPATAPIVVAAAGNGGRDELAFPARFDGVVAVVGTTSTMALAPYSNRGTYAWRDAAHTSLFAAPGGDGPPDGGSGDPTEWIASYVDSRRKVYGTSPATAYATAAVARVRASTADRSQALSRLGHRGVGPGGIFRFVGAA